MLFVVHCLDKPGMFERRMEAVPAHRDYIDNSGVKIVMSGPLVADDDESNIIGSLYVMEAENRTELEAILKNDPLVLADIWDVFNVHAFIKRVG